MKKRISSIILLFVLSCIFWSCGEKQGGELDSNISQENNQIGNQETDKDDETPKTYTISVLKKATQYSNEGSYERGEADMIVSYSYNEAGYRISSQAQYFGSTEWNAYGVYKYNEKNQLIEFDEGFYHYLYEYNEDGQLYKTIELGTKEVCSIYEYDANGYLIKDTIDNGYWTEYEYDNAGNLLKKTYNNADGKTYMYETYEYDENGNNVKVVNYGSQGMNSTTLYEYDENGNCISKTFTWYVYGTEEVDFIAREFYEYEEITVTR